MKIINSDLTPWNIYCDHSTPDKSVTANVYADNKEWYNSYMPPFFLMNDFDMIAKLKLYQNNEKLSFMNVIENHKEGATFLKNCNRYFSKENRINSLKLQYQRIKTFFETEALLLDLFEKSNDIFSFSALLLISINLMQKYMNPLEAFTTGKKNPFCTIDKCFESVADQNEQNLKVPMLETIFIPLAILYSKKIKLPAKYVFLINQFKSLMNCSDFQMREAFRFTNNKFKYTNYMDKQTAFEILDLYLDKLKKIGLENLNKMPAYHLQALNGIMTWSKYIPISKKPLRFRYFCEIDSLKKILSFPEICNDKKIIRECQTITTSGSEKYAKTIYILSTLFGQSKKFRNTVQKKALEKFDKILTI